MYCTTRKNDGLKYFANGLKAKTFQIMYEKTGTGGFLMVALLHRNVFFKA